MNKRKLLPSAVIIMVLVMLLPGCNQEKAEAIKVAAEKFRIEAISALEKTKALMKQSLMVADSKDDAVIAMTKDLEETKEFDATKLTFLIHEPEMNTQAIALVDKKFDELNEVYFRYENMFHSLPAGSYFAKDAVSKAQKQTMQLTLNMINFAEYLKTYPVQFTARRVLIIQKINDAKKTPDKDLRKERLAIMSKEILQLAKEEQTAKQEAIVQCLKAAEAGKAAATLIKDYGSMTINDMLVIINTSLGFVSELGYSDQKLDTMIGEYKSYEDTVRKDPYWSLLLEEKITH